MMVSPQFLGQGKDESMYTIPNLSPGKCSKQWTLHSSSSDYMVSNSVLHDFTRWQVPRMLAHVSFSSDYAVLCCAMSVVATYLPLKQGRETVAKQWQYLHKHAILSQLRKGWSVVATMH